MSRLYVMFIPGLCGWQGSDPYCHGTVNAVGRARATFRTLTSALQAAGIHYTPLYYSYDPARNGSYTVNDTHQSVARSVDALENQLRAVWKRNPAATFDLVGHSLGGVVAASWAVTNGRSYGYNSARGLLGQVNSIVTFDSPVRGMHSRLTGNIVARLFGGPVWYSLQPDAETIKEIVFFPSQWWKTKGHLHSIANASDLIVSVGDSTLGESRVVRDGSCPADILFIRSCHGAVLSDAALNRWVACHWVTDATQCLPPTVPPTATPPPTASLTPTPTASPVPVTSPTPIPQGTIQP